MSEVTLTVPAAYVEFFKVGVLIEIETDCGALIDNAQEMAAKPGRPDSDVQATARFVTTAVGLLSQLQNATPGEDARVIEAENDGILEHALSATARVVVGPRLQDQLQPGDPVDGEAAVTIETLTGALRWAVEASARCVDSHATPAGVA
jgi:hypothetical protein